VKDEPGQENKLKKTIRISTGNLDIKLQLNETETARSLFEVLPVSSSVNRWGDEIYFSIPLKAGVENGVEEVEIGTVAFWPPGRALCIFFGRTPASTGDKPRAASPVTIVGNIIDPLDMRQLKEVKSGEKIEVMH